MRKAGIIITVMGFIILLTLSISYSEGMGKKSNAQSSDKNNNQPKMSDTAAMILKQKRAEIFKEMGWIEGKYANEKEKEIAEKFKIKMSEKRRKIYLGEELMLVVHRREFNKDWIRPLVEIIYNSNISPSNRSIALSHLAILGNTKTIPIFKSFLNDKNTQIQIVVGNALYYLGEKKIAFEVYERLVKNGVVISNKYFNFSGDTEAKPMLFRIIRYNNPEMQALGLYYLAKMGERESIIDIYLKLKKEGKAFRPYLDWTARELGVDK